MATRFYCRADGTAPITPNVDAAWESSAAPFGRCPMYTTTDAGDALTTTSGFTSTAGQDRCHRQLISQPLAAGHIFNTGVTYKCYVQGLESAANDNIKSRLCVRILSNDGTVVRHTVLAVADYSTATEWNTALRNKAFADGDAGVGSYTTVAGDRLVVEIGHNDTAGSSISASTRWGSAGSADLGENETSTSTSERPWFETSLNLTFEPTAINVAAVVNIALSAAAVISRVRYVAAVVNMAAAVTAVVTRQRLVAAAVNMALSVIAAVAIESYTAKPVIALIDTALTVSASVTRITGKAVAATVNMGFGTSAAVTRIVFKPLMVFVDMAFGASAVAQAQREIRPTVNMALGTTAVVTRVAYKAVTGAIALAWSTAVAVTVTFGELAKPARGGRGSGLWRRIGRRS